MTPLSKKTLE